MSEPLRRSAPGIALAGATLLTFACGPRSPDAPVIVRDSAGITLVQNYAPVWDDRAAWRVTTAPDIRIAAAGDSGGLREVMGALRLPDARIVVASGATRELHFYDVLGHYRSTAGGEGEGPGQFRTLARLALLPPDSLLAWDPQRARVSVFTSNGEFGRAFGVPPLLPAEAGAVAGAFADGSILLLGRRVLGMGDDATGSSRDSVTAYHLSRDGARLDTLGRFPVEERFTFAGEGGNVMAPPPFSPEGIFAAAGDHLLYGWSSGWQIQVLAPDGRLLRSVRSSDPLPRVTRVDTAAERAARLAPLREASSRARMNAMLDAAPWPRLMPAFRNIVVDDAGDAWVEHYRRPGDAQPRWTVFDRTGRMLGTLTTPPGLQILQIGADFVLGAVTDSLGVATVQLHALARNAH